MGFIFCVAGLTERPARGRPGGTKASLFRARLKFMLRAVAGWPKLHRVLVWFKEGTMIIVVIVGVVILGTLVFALLSLVGVMDKTSSE